MKKNKNKNTKTFTKLNLGMIPYWCKLHLSVKERKRAKKRHEYTLYGINPLSLFISVLEFNVFHDLDSFDL